MKKILKKFLMRSADVIMILYHLSVFWIGVYGSFWGIGDTITSIPARLTILGCGIGSSIIFMLIWTDRWGEEK